MADSVGRRSVFFNAAPVMLILAVAWPACGEIDGGTRFSLDLCDAKIAAKLGKWSDPKWNAVTPEGLGWGRPGDTGSRDFWLETSEPIGIGLSWRPTSVALIRATVEQTGMSGILYVRYSADAQHWSTWQVLEARKNDEAQTLEYAGELRVPTRESARYDDLRLKYARREDVPWSSDEEALAREILHDDPKFFEETIPFIGYLQFLYEGQLPSGVRIKRLQVQANWFLGGRHHPPKDENADKNREGPWRFRTP